MKNWKLVEGNKINESGFDTAKEILTNKNIVIADDNSGTLKWVKFTMEEYGATVHIFEHGQDTIDYIKKKKNKPDLLILDLIMNSIGGIEIAKANKALQSPSKILFLTGCEPGSDDYKEAAKIGAIVEKPIGTEKLIGKILGLFSEKQKAK